MLSILNLYAGIGGNRYKWGGDIAVTAVEKNKQIANIYKELNPNDELIIDDAHNFLLENANKFDFIWSSPPCQTHTQMIRSGRNRKPIYPVMDLYQEIIFLNHSYDGKWVVENVKPYYKPLISPTQTIGRHLFWSNFWFHVEEIKQPKNFIVDGTIEGKKRLMEWLGIPYITRNVYYDGNNDPAQIYRNAVHPDLSLGIFNFLEEPTTSTQLQFEIERGENATSA